MRPRFEYDQAWPDQAAVLAQLGSATSPSVSSASSAGNGVSEAEIRANILADIGECDVENISSTCRLSLSCLFNNHEREREREREICSANGPQE